MITRELKLKLNKSQEAQLDEWLWILTGVYNWAIRKIELNAANKVYFSEFDFQNLLAGHSKKLKISAVSIQDILNRAFCSWQRCFKKLSKKPRMKGNKNKLRSIQFGIPNWILNNKIRLGIIGELRFHKQKIPEGRIKCARIIKRASGWYCQLTIDTIHKFEVKETEEKVGIDSGFKSLLTLSTGEVFENPRELRKGEKRIAQAQRGKNKKLVARLHERQANRRKDRNHKISRILVENFAEIYFTNDNLLQIAKRFGKSISESAIGQLKLFLTYKSKNCGRKFILVRSGKTTMICSNCQSLTGPTGLSKLAVRSWVCSTCGVHHDRDVNAAINILNFGLGSNLDEVA